MNVSQISLMTLNIEADCHLSSIAPFLERRRPDVLCLQEVLYPDFEHIAASLQMRSFFLPMCLVSRSQDPASQIPGGIAVLVKPELQPWFNSRYYVRHSTYLDVCENRGGVPSRRGIVTVDIHVGNVMMRIGTVHHMVTEHGISTPLQLEHTELLFSELKTLHQLWKSHPDEIVICGDFNAPRLLHGQVGETYARLASVWKDNIPKDVTSTLDPVLHRAAPLSLVVDYVFSTPEYAVSDVEVLTGLSDHCAILCQVHKSVV
jgi:endonuclease/exonuclease/phosphatase family metal-dependent hydrolase